MSDYTENDEEEISMAQPELMNLPDEMLAKIINYLPRQDRVSMCLVNRRMRDVHELFMTKYFCLQGNRVRMFKYGLKRLLSKNTCREILVFRFEQYSCTKYMPKKSLFGTSIEDHSNASYCQCVTSLTFKECVIDDKTFSIFRRLFKNVKTINIEQCGFLITSRNFIDDDLTPGPTRAFYSPLETVTITIPVAVLNNSPGQVADMLDWLISTSPTKPRLVYKFKLISDKRAFIRRVQKVIQTSKEIPDDIYNAKSYESLILLQNRISEMHPDIDIQGDGLEEAIRYILPADDLIM